MALRALLFSKNPDTVAALSPVLQESGIHAEICNDIFAAMEKGTKQPYSAVFADWADQPEAGFLLKRARESAPNRGIVVIAIVDGDPTPDEEREHRLDFMIFRPIVADEARAVLAKARQQMQLHSTAFATDANASLDHPEYQTALEPSEEPDLVSTAADLPETMPIGSAEDAEVEAGASEEELIARAPRKPPVNLRVPSAIALTLAAAFFIWKGIPAFRYLSKTPEGTYHVLKQSVGALFYTSGSGAQSVGNAMTDAQQDAYFTRTPPNGATQPQSLNVVNGEIALPDNVSVASRAFDLPLPIPLPHVDPVPPRVERARVPDSLKSSAPVSRPVVVTVGPGQMMPVSAPAPPAPQYGAQSVQLSEAAARALMIHSVDPIYPPEAMAQKLQGPVVLQATIGKDGIIADLKLVRGYFVLGRAAIAAVKQWRFQPSVVNGKTVEAQTVITVIFTYPPG